MPGRSLDLDPESRQALEFDPLLEVVAGYARTPMGARRVRALQPGFDEPEVCRELEAAGEAARHLTLHGRLLQGSLPDPGTVLEALSIEGARIDAKPLRELAAAADGASEIGANLRALPEEEFPRLHELGRGMPQLRSESRSVLAHVDPEGRIGDDASPELKSIRTSLKRIGERLRGILQKRLRDPEAEPVIQDDFITQRNSRYVIPIRTDAPRPVEGIVHASSSSGATLFVEPLETVPLNNELVRLAEEELEEQERILQDWAAGFRARLDDVVRAIGLVAAVDDLQARALFAAEAGAVVPTVGEGEPLKLRGVRHPLLDRRLREIGQSCVPLDLGLDPSDQVLLISGPNTGGKTVALKTLGLMVLMAQSGLPVPAVEARLPLYRQVRADVGDHQSIQADLSTFSAHLIAVVRFLEDLRVPALVLFDEIGTGTEPVEGAALARAVLEELLGAGITAVATTHQRSLKAWAFTTEGAVSAAMEFDTETLRPTYRVLMGAAGVSAGLDIAARIGLPREIVERARGYLAGEGARGEAYLERLRELNAGLEEERRALAEQRGLLEEQERRSRAKVETENRRRSDEASRALEAALEAFRGRARRELASIRDPDERARAERRKRRAEGKLQSELARQKARLAPHSEAAEHRKIDGEPRPGMRVRVQTLGRDGEIVAVRGDQIDVLLGRMQFTVERSDLRQPGPPEDRPAKGRARTLPRPVPRAAPAEPARPEPRVELMLIGKTVDEALPELDRSLDAAALAGQAELRVVHGHGTGRLRNAVRRFLKGHAHVERQRPGEPYEGGDGATVVTLK